MKSFLHNLLLTLQCNVPSLDHIGRLKIHPKASFVFENICTLSLASRSVSCFATSLSAIKILFYRVTGGRHTDQTVFFAGLFAENR